MTSGDGVQGKIQYGNEGGGVGGGGVMITEVRLVSVSVVMTVVEGRGHCYGVQAIFRLMVVMMVSLVLVVTVVVVGGGGSQTGQLRPVGAASAGQLSLPGRSALVQRQHLAGG